MGMIFRNNGDSNLEIIVDSNSQIKYIKLVFPSNLYSQVNLIKLNGDLVISRTIPFNQTHINLSLKRLSSGIYDIHLKIKQAQISERLILKYTA